MPKITVDRVPDKEAVLDADASQADFFHKLEVNELSRQSVCIFGGLWSLVHKVFSFQISSFLITFYW